MPNIPAHKTYPPDIPNPIDEQYLRRFYQVDDQWTQQVAQLLNTGLLTKLLATTVSVPQGSGSVTVTFAVAQPDTNYLVLIETSWGTTHFITAKAAASFTANFGTAAPNGATFSWAVLR